MDPVKDCRGKPCHRPADCMTHEACLYKSSADEYRESRLKEMKTFIVPATGEVEHLPPRQAGIVRDFEGEIDGKGIKQVMFSSKSPLQLITPEFTEGLAAVLLHGAKKYAPNNWMRGMSWTTVYGGIQRHLTAFHRGEEIDPESGLPHLHHAACGLMFLSWYSNSPHRAEHAKFDDRGYKV